jgi:hypothetical protein
MLKRATAEEQGEIGEGGASMATAGGAAAPSGPAATESGAEEARPPFDEADLRALSAATNMKSEASLRAPARWREHLHGPSSRKVVAAVTTSSRSTPWLGSARLTPPPLLCLPAVGERKGGPGSISCAVRGAGAPPAGRHAPSRGIGRGSSGAHAGGGAESSTRAAVPGDMGGWVGGGERWGEVGPTTDGEI